MDNTKIRNQQSAIRNALVECVPNFSEGRKTETVARLAQAISSVPTACVLDTHIDPDHNRSVITFVAAPEMVVAAAFGSQTGRRANRHAATSGCASTPGCYRCAAFHSDKRRDDG